MKTIKQILGLLSCLGLMGCQSPQYVTLPNYPSEAALVANAYQNGLTAELDIPYLQAYRNLKQAYQRCVAFSTDKDVVFTDNRLEPEIELGILFARTDSGAYLQKTLVEGIDQDKTRISLFLPKQYKFAQNRFKRDLSRAMGTDRECSIGAVIPLHP